VNLLAAIELHRYQQILALVEDVDDAPVERIQVVRFGAR